MWYRHFCKIGLLVAVFMVTGSDSASAAKLSNMINNVVGSWDGIHNIFSTIAYLSGGFLGVAGIFKFKDHVDNPSQTPISAGVKRMLAGGMFLSLPFMLNAARGSLFGGMDIGGNAHNVTKYTPHGAISADGLDRMVVNFMSDIGRPIEVMLVAFCYIAGTALMLVGISRLTKRMEEGPRGPAGMGTIMTFIAASALFSFSDSVGTFSSSLFGNNEVMTEAAIDPDIISNAQDRQRIQVVIEAVMLFVMIVGYIAFIRGWFVLKAFADGQQGATLAQGLTFLFGGSLAINLGELVNALQATVGITDGLTFN